MQRVVDPVSSFNGVANPERVLGIQVSGYGIVTYHDRNIDYIYTVPTADCTGLALMSAQGTMAMAHMFSHENFIHASRGRLESHALRIWDEFSAALPENEKYHATAFGGQRSGIGLEEASKWPIDLVRRAAVSECLGNAFLKAARESGRVYCLDDHRFADTPQDAVLERQSKKIILGGMYDALRQKMPPFENLKPGKIFHCAYGLYPE